MNIRGWTAGVLTAVSASIAGCASTQTQDNEHIKKGPYQVIENGCPRVVGPNDDPKEKIPCQSSNTLD
jgi:hypothetical protein